jgi:hypothetical protein
VAFRFEASARRRAALAGTVGVGLIAVFGPLLAVPAVALVALVYYGHQLAAAAVGDEGVRYPNLAFVIVVNALAVLVVQVVIFVEGFNVRTT